MAICQISSNDLGYPCTPELVEAKLKKLDHGREEVFVAVARDKVVGYLHVEKYDVLYAGTMANILGLAVELDHRKQGVGKLLVGEAEEHCVCCLINYLLGNKSENFHKGNRKQEHHIRHMGGV